MYRTSPAGFTLVVTGNATWAELRQLAASLRPVLPGIGLAGHRSCWALSPGGVWRMTS
jgi:hypothetical protein